jgi:hypothetical protein
MTVLAFTQRETCQPGAWRASELNRIVGCFASELASGEAGGWETAATEAGDPQFYLLGQPPDEECILCVSRLGRLYVLEDGNGHVLAEHVDFELLAGQARTFLQQTRAGLLAHLAVAWGIVRQAFEEKVEPMLAEGEEFLMHFAPQLAALA